MDGSTKVILGLVETHEKFNRLDWRDDIEHIEQMREQTDKKCSETLVSDRRHMSELLVPGFGRPVLLYRDGVPRARGMAPYVRDGYGAFRQPKFESEAVERCWYSGCVVLDRTSICSVCIATLT